MTPLTDFNVRKDLSLRKGYLQGRFDALPMIAPKRVQRAYDHRLRQFVCTTGGTDRALRIGCLVRQPTDGSNLEYSRSYRYRNLARVSKQRKTRSHDCECKLQCSATFFGSCFLSSRSQGSHCKTTAFMFRSSNTDELVGWFFEIFQISAWKSMLG